MNVLFEPVVLALLRFEVTPEKTPLAVFPVPVVLYSRAEAPVAVFTLPVVFRRDKAPIAVFPALLVILSRAAAPTATL
jgi:hypothetical protein